MIATGCGVENDASSPALSGAASLNPPGCGRQPAVAITSVAIRDTALVTATAVPSTVAAMKVAHIVVLGLLAAGCGAGGGLTYNLAASEGVMPPPQPKDVNCEFKIGKGPDDT